MKWLRRILLGGVALVAVAYAGGLAYLYVFQRDFQYDVAGEVLPLAATQLSGAQLVEIPTSDNEVIRGWFAAPAADKPLIVYFRGNTGSFTREHERYEQFVADGYGFLAFDYRGFPASPGVLNQDNVLDDGLAAYDYAAATGFPLVIWGRSLGSGPATYVASQRPTDALLLETPFNSAVSVAADRYGFFPVQWVMQDQYPVDQWIAGVTAPVFVAHGDADTTIASSHGERVHALAPNPAGLWIVPGADHVGLWERGLWGRAEAFFDGAEAAPAR